MKKRLAGSFVLAVIVVIYLMMGCLSASAATIYTIPVEVKYGQTEARSMLDMINKFRTGKDAWYYTDDSMTTKKTLTNLSKLEYDYGLEQIAMQRAADIALYFDHSRPDGSYCFDVTTSTGYSSSGENIAVGYDSAKGVFEAWQETNEGYTYQGHRRNMLGGYTHVGIAHVYFNGCHFWVQEFGYSSTGVSKTSANDSKKIVNVDVSTDNIWYNYVEDAPSSLTMSLGKSTKVPTVTMMFGTYIQWGGYYRHTVTPDWTVSGSAVTISGGNITAKSIGSATLTATIYGNKVTVKVTVECTDHKWGGWSTTKEATCTDKGSQTRKCSVCGKAETKSVAAKGHSFGSYKVTKEATCTADGSEQRKCSACGKTETRAIEAKSHSFGSYKVTKEATCTEEGSEQRECSVCNKTETRKITAKGHSWGDYKVITKATEDTEGLEERTCSVCSETEQRAIAKLTKKPDSSSEDASDYSNSSDSSDVSGDSSDVDTDVPDTSEIDDNDDSSAVAADDEESSDISSEVASEPQSDNSDEPADDIKNEEISESSSAVELNESIKDGGNSSMMYISIAAGAVLLLGGGTVLIIILKRR